MSVGATGGGLGRLGRGSGPSYSVRPVASNVTPQNSDAVGTMGRVFSGGGNNILGQANSVWSDVLAGSPTNLGGLESALNRQFSDAFAGRAADLREQMGGLGMRFSSDVSRQLADAATSAVNQQMTTLAQATTGAAEGAAGRQLQGLQLALNAPGQLTNLAQQGFQLQRQPLIDALSFATNFAPVGQNSSSKGFNVGI